MDMDAERGKFVDRVPPDLRRRVRARVNSLSLRRFEGVTVDEGEATEARVERIG
jgi:hypothetical protein